MTWSITPFLILTVVLLPVIVYLVYHRIKDIKQIKIETQNKIDQILEEQLKHDIFLRGSDTANKQLLIEIKETGLSTSNKLMAIISKVLNGGRHE